MAIRFYGVDDSQVDVTEKKSTSLNDKTGWYYGPDYEYTEVAVSSAEILDFAATQKEILPALSGNQYYEYSKVILEYTHVTTSYTLGTVTHIALTDGSNFFWKEAPAGMLNDGSNTICMLDLNNSGTEAGNDNSSNYSAYTIPGSTQKLVLGTVNSSDAFTNTTLGDGTLLVKIWYKVKTFGTEL